MKNLEQMQAAYRNIPIPDELLMRVQQSILQTRRQQKKEKVLLLLTRSAKAVGATAAALLLTITVLANSSANVAMAMEKIPVLGAITRVVQLRSYDRQDGGASAHIEQPQIEGADTANAAIEKYVDTILEQYQQDAAEVGEEGNYRLDLSYQTVTDNEKIFALRLEQTQIAASGTETVQIYAVEKSSGRLLTLSDLFEEGSDWEAVLFTNVREQMRQRMDADENAIYWLDEENESWNFTEVAADTAFYLDEEGRLVLVFNEGDIAPMYMGIIEFTIPETVTRSIAREELLG